MTDIPTLENFQPKGFWSRPEGKYAGTIALILLGCLGIWGAGIIMPFVMTALEDTLTAGLLFLGVAVMFMILTNKRFWSLISGIFKLTMRKATGIFIAVDPIGIMKNYVEKLADRITQIHTQIQKLRGQMGSLKLTITNNLKIAGDALKMAQAAKKSGIQTQVVLNARKYGRTKESNVTLEQLYAKLEGLSRVLNKMAEVSEFVYEDTKDKVETLEREKKAVDAGYSAMTLAMSFIRDSSDDKKIYDQATQFVVDETGRKLGEIDQFIDVATPFIDGVNLQNMTFEEDALRDLETWEKRADKLTIGDVSDLLSDEQLAPLLDAHDTTNDVPLINAKNSTDRVPVTTVSQIPDKHPKYLK
jgi:hypothetical protein